MPKEQKTAAELSAITKQKLNDAGLIVADVHVYPMKQLGWDASAPARPQIANEVAATVQHICRELRGLYDLKT